MTKVHYLALLRGINVGGNNLIKMTALRECFERMGFENVKTYIQSGNVIFSASGSIAALETKIEKRLSKAFSYTSRVVVIPRDTLKRIITEAPNGFGKEPKKYRYNVFFLKKPLTPTNAMKVVETRDGVDGVYQGKRVLYFKYLLAKTTQSRISKLFAKPEHQYMTIRNWNTTTKLLALMDKT